LALARCAKKETCVEEMTAVGYYKTFLVLETPYRKNLGRTSILIPVVDRAPKV
jgi:hypothetical protein